MADVIKLHTDGEGRNWTVIDEGNGTSCLVWTRDRKLCPVTPVLPNAATRWEAEQRGLPLDAWPEMTG